MTADKAEENASNQSSASPKQQSMRSSNGDKKTTSTTSSSKISDAVGQGDLGGATAQVADQMQQTVSGIAGQARQQAMGQVAQQKERAAGGLDMVSELLRQASQQVREQDKAPVATSIDGVAERVDQLADALRTKEIDELIDETKQFAARQPLLFVGGALTLGFIGMRFFRSSASQGGASQSGSASGGSGQRHGNTSSQHGTQPVVLHDLAELDRVVVPADGDAASAEAR